MSFLVAILLRGVGVASVGLILLALTRRSSSASRHAICALCLGTMLTLPLGLVAAPKRAVPLPEVTLPKLEMVRPDPHGVVRPIPITPRTLVASPAGFPISFGSLFFVFWALGAGLLAARLLLGWLTVVGWARRSRPLLDQRTPFDVGVSSETAVPLVAWVGRTVILLPQDHVHWGEARRAAVLAHESAHARRGDWTLLVLARLALALHWPNPLAWSLVRAARRLAEDAADDAVLREGLRPVDYADHLLDLARSVRRSVLALPMAQKADVHRRIHNVLNPRKSRGSVSLTTLAVAGLALGGVFVPATCLVLQARSAQNPTSWAPDVRTGKSVAGDPSNGFVGQLSDGRPIEMVQLTLKTAKGIEAWKPDGTPIPPAERVDLPTIGEHYRTILVRFKNATKSPSGGLGSGGSIAGEPSTMTFGGGGDRPARKAGEWETYSYIAVPKEDGDRASFTFGLSDSLWTTEAKLPGKAGKQGDAGRLRDIVVAYPENATPFHRDAKGRPMQDQKGTYLHDKIPSTGVAFTLNSDDALRGIQLTATLKNGKKVEPIWNDGGYKGNEFKHHWYFDHAPKEIMNIQIETRDSFHVEFNNVALKPNSATPVP